MKFVSIEEMVASVSEMIRPPLRLTVTQAAKEFRKLNNPGAYVGDWDNTLAPYLNEPMDLLTSAAFTGMIFCGPAQCGKTEIGLNWQLHSAICDPADMLIVEKSQTAARDFSKRRIDRLHRHSPDVAARLAQTTGADNVFDKQYTSGMMVTLSWPAINELSGKPIPRLFLTDYDRMPQDVDHEGSPFDLARKRATTFRRYGMTVAESSPGFVVSDSKWISKSRHEAPPTQDSLTNSGGILSLYNRGDRRRWYWRCPQCKNSFEPDFSLLDYPESADAMESAEQVKLVCPHCGWWCYHEPRDGLPGKHEMNLGARWVQDGMLWTPEDTLTGTAIRSDIASFWLKGPAAAFVDWKTLIINYLKALEEYQSTGSEEALKTTVMTDQGLPYTPKSLETERRPEELKARARDLGQRAVPVGVRFLVACIDVQRKWLQVQVHGVGVGGDIWIIDSYAMRKSRRFDEDGERFFMSPGSHPEDWKQIVEEVMLKTYPLNDGSGREMSIKFTACDSGGAAGVTTNAYNFVRWLRRGPEDGEKDDYGWVPGLAARFVLVRGDHNANIPRTKLKFPDAQKKDRHASARGDVPVLFINSNSIKDTVNHKLDRMEPNGGRVNFPSWLPDSFYTELTVEIKTPKGWENPRDFRNEAWDLLCYCEALCVSSLIKLEQFRWENPPGWATDWSTEENDLVFVPKKDAVPFVAIRKTETLSLEKLAETLA